ncbi:MAG: hypothetical protein L0177_14080, partial [Chloroflexi bacterium]|nr:hypothetical protein [Chloroflexota bacterium]
GEARDVVFVGPVPGILPLEDRTRRVLGEIESGEVRVFPPALALQALGACIGALAAGSRRCAVPLPIDPASDEGRTEWPIS